MYLLWSIGVDCRRAKFCHPSGAYYIEASWWYQFDCDFLRDQNFCNWVSISVFLYIYAHRSIQFTTIASQCQVLSTPRTKLQNPVSHACLADGYWIISFFTPGAASVFSWLIDKLGGNDAYEGGYIFISSVSLHGVGWQEERNMPTYLTWCDDGRGATIAVKVLVDTARAPTRLNVFIRMYAWDIWEPHKQITHIPK